MCLVDRFLVTTALEETWPEDPETPVLFLGEWSENVGLNIVQQIQDYAHEVENLQQSDSPTPYQFRNKKT